MYFICIVQIYLVPEARYEVCDGDHLTFADVECVYTKSDGSRVSRHRQTLLCETLVC